MKLFEIILGLGAVAGGVWYYEKKKNDAQSNLFNSVPTQYGQTAVAAARNLASMLSQNGCPPNGTVNGTVAAFQSAYIADPVTKVQATNTDTGQAYAPFDGAMVPVLVSGAYDQATAGALDMVLGTAPGACA